MSRTRALLLCGAAAVTLATASHDPVEAANRLEVTLNSARVDMIQGDRIVASFNASGDVRGIFTATIDRDASGALRGEWVLVSRYLRDLTPEGQPDTLALLADERASLPGQELHTRHKEYFDIHDRGTLRGSIAGGSLSLDVDGRLRSIEALQLVIDGGDLEFKGAKGAASLTGINLQTIDGVGSLTLAQTTPAQEVK